MQEQRGMLHKGQWQNEATLCSFISYKPSNFIRFSDKLKSGLQRTVGWVSVVWQLHSFAAIQTLQQWLRFLRRDRLYLSVQQIPANVFVFSSCQENGILSSLHLLSRRGFLLWVYHFFSSLGRLLGFTTTYFPRSFHPQT